MKFSEYMDYSKCICEERINDTYSNGKYCLNNNAIYFWKGQKYEAEGIYNNYNYVNSVSLKNEECQNETKNCGILDDNENKLCIPNNFKCPVNIISEEKLYYSNSSFKVGNKTFYYGYDEKAKNKKIIAGLYIDTDIYLNKKEKDYILLDGYTISGFLKDNKNLYNGVILDFDPYINKDIDKKGKSYLKIRYNENVDLVSLRDNHHNINIWNNTIKSITNNCSIYIKIGIVGISYLIFILLILILIGVCENKNKELNCFPKLKNKNNFLYCFVPILIPFFVLSIIPAIKSCNIVGKLNKIDGKIEFSISSLIITNIIFIAFIFLLYGCILAFIVIFYIYGKRFDIPDKREREIKDAKNISLNNLKADMNEISTIYNSSQIGPKN